VRLRPSLELAGAPGRGQSPIHQVTKFPGLEDMQRCSYFFWRPCALSRWKAFPVFFLRPCALTRWQAGRRPSPRRATAVASPWAPSPIRGRMCRWRRGMLGPATPAPPPLRRSLRRCWLSGILVPGGAPCAGEPSSLRRRRFGMHAAATGGRPGGRWRGRRRRAPPAPSPLHRRVLYRPAARSGGRSRSSAGCTRSSGRVLRRESGKLCLLGGLSPAHVSLQPRPRSSFAGAHPPLPLASPLPTPLPIPAAPPRRVRPRVYPPPSPAKVSRRGGFRWLRRGALPATAGGGGAGCGGRPVRWGGACMNWHLPLAATHGSARWAWGRPHTRPPWRTATAGQSANCRGVGGGGRPPAAAEGALAVSAPQPLPLEHADDEQVAAATAAAGKGVIHAGLYAESPMPPPPTPADAAYRAVDCVRTGLAGTPRDHLWGASRPAVGGGDGASRRPSPAPPPAQPHVPKTPDACPPRAHSLHTHCMETESAHTHSWCISGGLLRGIALPSGRPDGRDSARVAAGLGMAGGDGGDGRRCLALAVTARQHRRQAVGRGGVPATRCGVGVSSHSQPSEGRRDSVDRRLGVAVPPPPPRTARGVPGRRRRRPPAPRRRRCRHRRRADVKRPARGGGDGGHPRRGRVGAGDRRDRRRRRQVGCGRGWPRGGPTRRRRRPPPPPTGRRQRRRGGSPEPPRRRWRRRPADRAWRASRPPPTECRWDMRRLPPTP